MKFKITSNSEDIFLTSEQLFTQILNQAFLDQEKTLTKNLEHQIPAIEKILRNLGDDYLDVSLNQIYTIFFLSGYYYKVFLNNNQVEQILENQG